MTKTTQITALDIREGDIYFNEGYRCVARDVTFTLEPQKDTYNAMPIQFWNAFSVPSADHPERLPRGYEGMGSAGNHLRKLAKEVA